MSRRHTFVGEADVGVTHAATRDSHYHFRGTGIQDRKFETLQSEAGGAKLESVGAQDWWHSEVLLT
jgi:hypothetical protein